jgi:hypothetical protein
MMAVAVSAAGTTTTLRLFIQTVASVMVVTAASFAFASRRSVFEGASKRI